jgi:hypothetical protein
MKRRTVPLAVVLCFSCATVVVGFHQSAVYAQSSNACPTGFSLVSLAETGAAPPESSSGTSEPSVDENLDGFVCQSLPDVRANGIVEIMLLDNDAEPCTCPDRFTPSAVAPADRNEDGITCSKIQDVPATESGKPPRRLVIVTVDNRRCQQP